MKPKIHGLALKKGCRIIAVSDIHGHLDQFKKLLTKTGFNKDDVLFVVGDYTEKGPDSLETVRYLMKLSKGGNVFTAMGNHDLMAWFVKGYIDPLFVINNAINAPQSLLGEMCGNLGIELALTMDIPRLRETLYRHYTAEIDWMMGLPDIYDTDRFVFVHSGLKSPVLLENEKFDVLKNDQFMWEASRFSRYVIVGHMPTVQASHGKLSYNPRIDAQRKVIAIDGGCGVKRQGQLNALLIPPRVNEGEEKFHFIYNDPFPLGMAVADQEERPADCLIRYPDNAVDIVEEKGSLTHVRHQSSGKSLWIPSGYLYQQKDQWRTTDIADYNLPVKKGDRISVVQCFEDRYLAKKDGVLGWIMGAPGRL